MGPYKRLQLAHDLGAVPEREVGLQALLKRDEVQTLQPADLVARENVVAEVRERRTPPEIERLTKDLCGLFGGAGRQHGATLLEQALEPVQIERLGCQAEHIPGPPRLHDAVAERLAQLRDVHLHSLGRSGRWAFAPELVDQRRRWEGLVGVQQ